MRTLHQMINAKRLEWEDCECGTDPVSGDIVKCEHYDALAQLLTANATAIVQALEALDEATETFKGLTV